MNGRKREGTVEILLGRRHSTAVRGPIRRKPKWIATPGRKSEEAIA
jgi:hypothetical protein